MGVLSVPFRSGAALACGDGRQIPYREYRRRGRATSAGVQGVDEGEVNATGFALRYGRASISPCILYTGFVTPRNGRPRKCKESCVMTTANSLAS
jgi:hypothetical protein